MCKNTTITNVLTAPVANLVLQTNMAACQRSAQFINKTNAPMRVKTGMMVYDVPAGNAASFPVGQDITVDAPGRGTVAYAVTENLLPAQMTVMFPNVQRKTLVVRTAGTLIINGNPTKLSLVYKSER